MGCGGVRKAGNAPGRDRRYSLSERGMTAPQGTSNPAPDRIYPEGPEMYSEIYMGKTKLM